MTRYRAHLNNLAPAIPFIFAYDEAGNQVFDSTGANHIWDTIKIITSHFEYTADKDRIYLNLNSSGLFKITFNCSFISYDESDDTTITTEIYKNGNLLAGSAVVSSVTAGVSQDDDIKNCQSISYVVYMEKDDYIQIQSSTNANSVYSIADSSRIIIEFLPMKGWNNSSGGRIDYKGGVMR